MHNLLSISSNEGACEYFLKFKGVKLPRKYSQHWLQNMGVLVGYCRIKGLWDNHRWLWLELLSVKQTPCKEVNTSSLLIQCLSVVFLILVCLLVSCLQI